MRILPIDSTGSDLLGIAPQQAGQSMHFNMPAGEGLPLPSLPPLPTLLSDAVPDVETDVELSGSIQPTEEHSQAPFGVYEPLPEDMDNLLAQLSYVPAKADTAKPADTPQVKLWQAPLDMGTQETDPDSVQDATTLAQQPVSVSSVYNLLPVSEAPVSTPLTPLSQPKPMLGKAELSAQSLTLVGHEGQNATLAKVTQDMPLPSNVQSPQSLVKQPQVALMTSSQTSIVNAVMSSEGQTALTSVWQSVSNEAHWKSESLGSQATQWGQKLLTMLSDKVQLQVGQQLQRAHIRLDPPQLGSIDISISIDQERTTIHLSTQHGQIRDALSQQLEQLRQNLMAKLGQEVQVQVDIHHQKQQQQAFSAQPQAIAGQWSDGSDDAKPAQTKGADGWLNTLA